MSYIITLNENQTKSIEVKEDHNKNTTNAYQRMGVNIVADIQVSVNRLTEIIQSLAEFEMVSKWYQKPFVHSNVLSISMGWTVDYEYSRVVFCHRGVLYLFHTTTNSDLEVILVKASLNISMFKIIKNSCSL